MFKVNAIICSLDESMFHVACNLIQVTCVVAYENLEKTLAATNILF